MRSGAGNPRGDSTNTILVPYFGGAENQSPSLLHSPYNILAGRICPIRGGLGRVPHFPHRIFNPIGRSGVRIKAAAFTKGEYVVRVFFFCILKYKIININIYYIIYKNVCGSISGYPNPTRK